MARAIVRVTTAGSVDDGKSTLLAQLLLKTGAISRDTLEQHEGRPLADLLDGLIGEQEQGITIDAAHRFADYDGTRFHFADSPGHDQYTRNMATACAGSDVLLLVVDAANGPRPQTLRHLEIAILLGVRRVVVAVNKMDLVDYAEEQFKTVQSMIEFEAAQLAATESHIHMLYIPVSALEAENILLLSTKMQWYKGPSLLDAVRYDSADDLINAVESEPSILQVQMAQRSGGARRYLANLVQGSLALGEKVFLGKKEVRVSDLFVSGSGQTKAHQGEHLSIEFDQEIDISRGDILTGEPQERYNQFEVELIWLADKPAQSNVRYLFKSGATMTSLRISEFIGQDALQAENREPSLVVKNDLCRAKIILGRPLFLRNFNGNPHLSSFILIDKDEGHTVAVGTVNRPIEASQNLTKQDFLVNPGMLCELTGNYPTVIWLTGLSGSGKSTLANKLSRELYHLGRPHAVLDGDNLRLGLNRDLGFSESDRNENIRRTAEAARLMSDSGLIVIVAMITPTHGDRALAKKIVGDDRFNLVFVNTPIEVCEQRDPKGLYEKARSGSLQNFTGVSAPFDIPSDAVEVSHNQQIPMRDLLDKLLHD